MKTKAFSLVCLALLTPLLAWAQTTRLLPWEPGNDDDGALVYCPEPILFVHGINANDGGWAAAISALTNGLAGYHLSEAASAFVLADNGSSRYRTTQEPYLHTFNYGDPTGSSTLNSNSFDHIEWNAWAWDRDNRFFTNTFTQALQAAPHDPNKRITLDERINGRQGVGGFSGIRGSYATNPNDTNTWPNVVLVAHSMGGLLCHYYLIQSAATTGNTGVRRLVALATPHLGSMIANWAMWDRNAGIVSHLFDGMRTLFIVPSLRLTANHIPVPPFTLVQHMTAGYYRYGQNGAVEDISVNNPNASSRLRHHNPLMDYFWANPAPPIEYVFNAYHLGLASFYQGEKAVTLPTLETEQFDGDGVVAPWSASGKTNAAGPSVWNGSANTNGNHAIDPVIFGVWNGIDHSHADMDTNSLLASLDGVAYRWSGSQFNAQPSYAQRYGEDQSFSKYFIYPIAYPNWSAAYSDEPGIDSDDVVLLYTRTGQNPQVIPTWSTWTLWYSNGWSKASDLSSDDFYWMQSIGGTNAGLRCLGRVGAKNWSYGAGYQYGSNYSDYAVWCGNEYLPASMSVQVTNALNSIVWATNAAALASATQIVNQCLVQFDTNGVPQYKYGYFDMPVSGPVVTNTNSFVAVQGFNKAGLVTEQAEVAYNVPIDSATVVGIFRKINQGEAFSNTCVYPNPITRWTYEIEYEWVDATNASFSLDFFPTDPRTIQLYDAWAWMPLSPEYLYTNWTYNVATKTITLTDPDNAPSQFQVQYQAWVGCDTSFTTNYNNVSNIPTNYTGVDFTVPALSNETLAGLQLDLWANDLLGELRSGLQNVIPKYQDTTSPYCAPWSVSNILAAVGNPTGWWTNESFAEVEAVANLLTNEFGCTTSNKCDPCTLGWCHMNPTVLRFQIQGVAQNTCFDMGYGNYGEALFNPNGAWTPLGPGPGGNGNLSTNIALTWYTGYDYGCSFSYTNSFTFNFNWTLGCASTPSGMVASVSCYLAPPFGGVYPDFSEFQATAQFPQWTTVNGHPAMLLTNELPCGTSAACGGTCEVWVQP
ncbi:MAG TPA: alpha/beta fold hydrolase [Verrucomicrobiae bacterium]|nr:alpha/beta fold hydrolase [Verrucomicrobiae bacterium]